MRSYTFLFRWYYTAPFNYFKIEFEAENNEQAHLLFNELFHLLNLTAKLERSTFSVMAESSAFQDLTVNYSDLNILPWVPLLNGVA